MTGAELADSRQKVYSITTGSKQLDTILGGGFQVHSGEEERGWGKWIH